MLLLPWRSEGYTITTSANILSRTDVLAFILYSNSLSIIPEKFNILWITTVKSIYYHSLGAGCLVDTWFIGPDRRLGGRFGSD